MRACVCACERVRVRACVRACACACACARTCTCTCARARARARARALPACARVRVCMGAWVRGCVVRGCVCAWVHGCVGVREHLNLPKLQSMHQLALQALQAPDRSELLRQLRRSLHLHINPNCLGLRPLDVFGAWVFSKLT